MAGYVRRSLVVVFAITFGLLGLETPGVAAEPPDPKAEMANDQATIMALIKILHDPKSQKRAEAAEEIRRIVAKYPSGTIYLDTKDGGEAAWRKKVDQVVPGMAKADVLKLLPAFAEAPESLGISDGGCDYVTYRLDYHWTVRLVYRNTGEVVSRPELKKWAYRVEPLAPKGFTGTWVTWHINGQKAHRRPYKDGDYEGVVTSYHDNGAKSTEQTYANRNAHGPGAGWNPDGTVSYTITYENGKQHGKWTHWYDNGQKHSECTYNKGVLDGRYTNWHENGQISLINDYKNGVKHGIEASWDEKGNQNYVRVFKDGKIADEK